MANPTNRDLLVEIKESQVRMEGEMKLIRSQLGETSPDGRGGTGLTGQVIRNTARLDGYDRIKWIAAGTLVAIGGGITSALNGARNFFIDILGLQ